MMSSCLQAPLQPLSPDNNSRSRLSIEEITPQVSNVVLMTLMFRIHCDPKAQMIHLMSIPGEARPITIPSHTRC